MVQWGVTSQLGILTMGSVFIDFLDSQIFQTIQYALTQYIKNTQESKNNGRVGEKRHRSVWLQGFSI